MRFSFLGRQVRIVRPTRGRPSIHRWPAHHRFKAGLKGTDTGSLGPLERVIFGISASSGRITPSLLIWSKGRTHKSVVARIDRLLDAQLQRLAGASCALFEHVALQADGLPIGPLPKRQERARASAIRSLRPSNFF